MSNNVTHTLTVTETTSDKMPSSLRINIGTLKTVPGLLKLFETVLAATCLGLMIRTQKTEGLLVPEEGFLYLVVVAFLLPTCLLLISSLVSHVTADLIQKTIFEFLYHMTAFVFYLSGSLNFIVYVSKQSKNESAYGECVAMAVLSFLNAVLYFVSTYFSFKSYRAS